MELSTIALLILAGFIAGLAGGVLGVGGGIVVIPVLIYIFGFSQHNAQGTSLAFLLLPIGIFAVINYARAGYVNWKFAIILAITFTVGSYFGSKWAVNLPSDTMRKIFSIFIILVGIKMLFGK
ncbi:MAG TPA: sulfite exporter TauE/SafE family protein [Bacteroidales bacterium]|nr:sulfite exporter TauE/SafE family protein [Bacteroidales bacterium]